MPNKTITIEAILTPEVTQCGLPGSSKKKVLEQVAKLIANHFLQLEENTIFDNLIASKLNPDVLTFKPYISLK